MPSGLHVAYDSVGSVCDAHHANIEVPHEMAR